MTWVTLEWGCPCLWQPAWPWAHCCRTPGPSCSRICRPPFVHALWKIKDPDPHHFGNPDPHPHQIKIRIRIRIEVLSWIRIRINLQKTSQKMYGIWAYLGTFCKGLSPYSEAWIRIRMRIRIRFLHQIKIRIRILINVMRIRNIV